MTEQVYVYDLYIRAPAERIWAALTQAEFTEQYFHGTRIASDWRKGAKVTYHGVESGDLIMAGEVLEAEPPKRLVMTWNFMKENQPTEAKASRVAFDIIDKGDGVCLLSITHDDFPPDSETFRGIRTGWTPILNSLKTLLETGTAMPIPG